MDRVSGSLDFSATLEPEKLSLADQLVSQHTVGQSVDTGGLAKDIARLKGQLSPNDYEGLKQDVGRQLLPFDSAHLSQALASAETGASGPSQASGPPENDKPYTVKAGDTLSSIAKSHGTTAAALQKANPQITNPNRLRQGDVMHLPSSSSPTGKPQTSGQHTAKAHQPRPTDTSLGHLSALHESGGDPGRVSTGLGDHGGISYGTYQIRTDNARNFVKHEGSKWSADFAGKKPGTPEFGQAWKDIAKREPEAFQEAQHQYIERSHYNPVADEAHKATGVDISQHSKALQNVVWSTADQLGPNAPFLTDAINKVINEQKVKPDEPDFDRELIMAIYDERGKTNAKGKPIHFSSSSPSVQHDQLVRFAQERAEALRELEAERRAASKSAQPEKGP